MENIMETRTEISLGRLAPLCPKVYEDFETSSPHCNRWYVVHTRPYAEMQAAVNLDKLGYPVFYPSLHKVVRHARRTSKAIAPLFPRYLFVTFDISRDRWRRINSTRGVTRLIMQGEIPRPVPVGVIELIIKHVNNDGTIRTLCSFEPGQAVRIENGPLADLVATFECSESDGRARVLAELLGQIVSIVLSKETFATAA
jgi:transcription elongation factor/antiterminator RfaH